jgi:hypothetical protein
MTTYEITEDISGLKYDAHLRTINCTWFFDPGHAWLQVNKQTLEDFGLTPADFSEFSRTDGHDLYLEEDCDAGIFIRAVGDKAELIFNEQECTDKFSVRAMQRNR